MTHVYLRAVRMKNKMKTRRQNHYQDTVTGNKTGRKRKCLGPQCRARERNGLIRSPWEFNFRTHTHPFLWNYSQGLNVDKSWICVTHLYLYENSNFNGKKTDKNKYILLGSVGFSYLKNGNNSITLLDFLILFLRNVGLLGTQALYSRPLPLVPPDGSAAHFPSSTQ